MSNKDLARRTDIILSFNGVDISKDINKYLISLSYTDNEEDKTDDLSLELDDRENVWLGNWLNTNKSSVVKTVNSSADGDISVGDSVMIREGAIDCSGVQLQDWVYTYTGFTVISVGVTNPDRIVVGIDGEITAAVKREDIIINGSQAAGASSGGATVGATISASIIQRNWDSDGKDKVLDCGTFQVDTIKAGGPPAKVTLKSTSLSYTSTARGQKKTKAWENIKLSAIASQIAKSNGMKCYYSSSYDPKYKRKEQVQTSDIAFLKQLCGSAGIALKVTANTFVLFDESEYESKAAIRTIKRGESNVIKYDFSDGLNDTAYSSCHVSYTNPETENTIEYTYTPRDSDGTGQVLEISEKVSTREEARQLAMKRLRQKNKEQHSASFRLSGDVKLVAGATVNVEGWGAFDGKYIIETAEHTVSASAGYQTYLTLRMVLEGY